MKNNDKRIENTNRTSTRAAGCPTDCGAPKTYPAVLGRVARAIEVTSAIINNNKKDAQ